MSFVKVLGYIREDNDNTLDYKFFHKTKSGVMHIPINKAAPIYVCQSGYSILEMIGYEVSGDDMYPIFYKIHRILDELLDKSTCSLIPEEKPGDVDISPLCSLIDTRWSYQPCPLLSLYGPFYVLPYQATERIDGEDCLYWCVVHPDEKERMERILNGTDNPLYDLVHELRYNPDMPDRFSSEKREAKNDFEQKKRKIE